MILFITVVLMFAISLIAAVPAEVAEQEAVDESGQVIISAIKNGEEIFN